jgi:hypothetical protein
MTLPCPVLDSPRGSPTLVEAFVRAPPPETASPHRCPSSHRCRRHSTMRTKSKRHFSFLFISPTSSPTPLSLSLSACSGNSLEPPPSTSELEPPQDAATPTAPLPSLLAALTGESVPPLLHLAQHHPLSSLVDVA